MTNEVNEKRMQHRRLNVKGYEILNATIAGGFGECVIVNGCGNTNCDVGVRKAHPNLRGKL